MDNPDFNNKSFLLVSNSSHGAVSSKTTFKFKQEDDLVTADYTGGDIVYGKIIALLRGTSLQMQYQCLTVDYELKAGKATAKISVNAADKMVLQLNWEWLDGKKEKGTSTYIEE